MTVPVAANSTQTDIWSDWLLRGRHGGDSGFEPVIRDEVRKYRDRVLDGAALSPGMVLVDVGAGDGLIAFGAFDRAGPSLQVTFVDISRPLLNRSEQLAVEHGVRDRCRFLETSAEQLVGVRDASADAVTTRAVLVYVPNKAAAASEFHRVLKSGGRLSMAEPIFQDSAVHLSALTSVLAARPPDDATVLSRLLQRFGSAQLPCTLGGILSNPLTSFTERDLIGFLLRAGFAEIHLQLHIDVTKPAAIPWHTYLEISPFPGAPAPGEILQSRFNASERRIFEEAFRPLVETGQLMGREVQAYITAVKS